MMRILGFEEYGGPEVARPMQVEEPAPGRGQLLVRMTAAGVNPADVKVRSGQRQGGFPVRFPMAMGREAAGVVLGVGAGVERFAPGQAVFGAAAAGTGTLAETVLLDAGAAAPIPEGVAAAQAASIPVSVGTAYDALEELDLPEGAILLVLGAGGGVGTAACGLGVARGLRVLGTASPAKREIVEGLGAEHLASGEGWEERVRAAAPEGVDAVVDLVGGQTLRGAAGLLRSPNAMRSPADPALAESLGGGGVSRRRTGEVFAEIAELIARGRFTPVIGATHPFDDAGAAVAAVESGHAAGNVVVLGEA